MKINHPEFRDELENTKYPFVPTASLSNNLVSFVEGTFLDAHIYAVTGTSRYYISKVVVTSSSVEVVIGDSNESERLTGTVAIPVTASSVPLKDEYNRSAGILVSEPVRLALLASWGVGEHTFEQDQTEFCVTCCMPVPEVGVTGLRLETGELLSGKVWLMGGDGVVIRKTQKENKQGETVDLIQMDVVGDPLALQRLCNSEDLFTPVNAIRTIRVIQGDTEFECDADQVGNFSIQMNDSLASDAALRIRTTPEGIVFNVEGSLNRG